MYKGCDLPRNYRILPERRIDDGQEEGHRGEKSEETNTL